MKSFIIRLVVFLSLLEIAKLIAAHFHLPMANVLSILALAITITFIKGENFNGE